MSIYTYNGYKNRAHYLESLAEDYGVDEEIVKTMAAMMGPDEDFDGLVSMIQDIADGYM